MTTNQNVREVVTLDPDLTRSHLRGGGWPDEVRLVGHLDVPGARVGLRVDGDGGDAEALGRGHDAARDLAAVGDQQLSKGMGKIYDNMTETECGTTIERNV